MKKIWFRFLFIFLLLTISPWYYLYNIPGVSWLLKFIGDFETLIVEFINKHLLHVKDVLNQNGGGSGDTSYDWARFYAVPIVSIIGCAVWTIIDRKRQAYYNTLDYWLRTMVRFYLVEVSLNYAFYKLFVLQMPFPSLSQLATPLGDYLPMRFSWMFLGYSVPYEVFSGVSELLVALLLFNRRTVLLGAMLGVGVYANVFMINMCYDVPVKLLSMQLFVLSVYLTLEDRKRLLAFFWFNKPAEPSVLYNISLPKKWQKITRIVLKLGFVVLFAVIPFNNVWNLRKKESAKGEMKPIRMGVYDIQAFVKNNDTITVSNDDMAWKDFIFDKAGLGSINTLDTLFRVRYRRGYFFYKPDSVKQTLSFIKSQSDTTKLLVMKYQILNDSTIELRGKLRADSIYYKLRRGRRHFQLAEKQFHWISEANR